MLVLNNTPKLQDESVANNSANMYPPQEVFRIQLPYDINQAAEQDFWNGNFHPISLHSALEHLPSDSNDIPDLSSIGKVTWNFISALYKLEWDLLVIDKDKRTFRQKVSSKFTLKIQEIKTKTTINKQTDKLASFVNLPLPIPTETSKEVKKISRFFKKSSQPTEDNNAKKLYIQASFFTTREILKIKETFLKLPVKKIKNIQKTINYNGKSKPKLNITTKNLSRKQVIVPINNEDH